MTYHHYENFPVASFLLPKGIRPHVAAIYAFARSADDFADERKYRGQGLKLLSDWRGALWACADGADGANKTFAGSNSPAPTVATGLNGSLGAHPIFLALGDTIRGCHLPVQLFDGLLTAFTMDVTKRRYADWNELLTYCRYSANPVGRLVLTLFGHNDPELFSLSDAICTGLQLANHWQDLGIDFFEKNRLYIPKTLMNQHGVSETELRAWKRGFPCAGIRPLMSDLVGRARDLFDQGETLPSRVSGRLRFELRLTLLGGRSILDQIAAADYDVLRRRPVLSTWSKVRLLAHAFTS